MYFRKRLKIFKKNTEELLVNKTTPYGLKRVLRRLLKEVHFAMNHYNGISTARFFKNRQFINVQIGGGNHILKNFLNIDITPPADLIYDVREGIPLQDNSVGFIFCEHFLEHIDYPVSAKKFIKECYRVLRSGGSLVVGVPDSEKILKAYYKKDNNLFKSLIKKWYSKRNILNDINTYLDLVNLHLRDQDDDLNYSPHFWGYDREKLIHFFHENGFKRIAPWRFDSKIANPKRKFGSVYVKAIK